MSPNHLRGSAETNNQFNEFSSCARNCAAPRTGLRDNVVSFQSWVSVSDQISVRLLRLLGKLTHTRRIVIFVFDLDEAVAVFVLPGGLWTLHPEGAKHSHTVQRLETKLRGETGYISRYQNLYGIYLWKGVGLCVIGQTSEKIYQQDIKQILYCDFFIQKCHSYIFCGVSQFKI